MQNLLTRITELEKEKKEIHDKFNAQRGRLQKLYIQKEEELNLLSSQHVKLEGEVIKLTKELDEAKSQLCIAGIVKENEVEAEKRKAQAEIATLNQIVHGNGIFIIYVIMYDTTWLQSKNYYFFFYRYCTSFEHIPKRSEKIKTSN